MTDRCVAVLQGDRGGLLRGIDLGEPISDVVAREGEDYDHRQEQRLYVYDRQLDDDTFFFYTLSIGYDDEGRVDNLRLDMSYDANEDYDVTLDEFRAFIDYLEGTLTSRYGEAAAESGDRSGGVTRTWTVRAAGDGGRVTAALVRYSDPRSGVDEAFGLEFHGEA